MPKIVKYRNYGNSGIVGQGVSRLQDFIIMLLCGKLGLPRNDQIISGTCIHHTFNDIKVFFEVIKDIDSMKYHVIFPPGEEVVRQDNNELEFRKNMRPVYLKFFLPSCVTITRQKDSSFFLNIVKPKGNDYNALLWVESSFHVTAIEPILAGSEPFPDNLLCGFTVMGENVKYVLFLHAENRQIYKGSDKISSSFFTVFKFQSDGLSDVWEVDSNRQVTHY